MPAGGGEAVQVTEQGGFTAAESPDGEWLYFSKPREWGLWVVEASGRGEPRRLTDHLYRSSTLVATTDGAIYSRPDRNGDWRITVVDRRTGKATVREGLRFDEVYSLDLSADGRRLLVSHIEDMDGDVYLAEDLLSAG